MPSATSVKKDFEKISAYREGARYCRMDLHTHSPASECSDFSLPSGIEDQFPKRLTSKAGVIRRFDFLRGLADGKNPFKKPYSSRELRSHPRLGKRAVLDASAVKSIAAVWLDDIRTFFTEDMSSLTKEQRDERDDLVERAFADLRRYLKSLFFPEEYVMRCYMEQLQLVALTDHNHPGYIVPRLPELGTWHSAIEDVNAGYAKDIRKKRAPGEKVRKVLVNRLKLAEKQLSKKHGKGAKKRKARLEHIKSRFKFWNDKENKPLVLNVLPGVEITVSNVHLLAVFPPKWFVAGRIGSILQSIGIPEVEWGRAYLAAASSSVQDTVSLVDDAGGIVIPAHCNSDFKGLLRLFTKGLALTKVLEHPALFALETVGGSVVKGKSAWQTLRWLQSGRGCPGRTKLITFIRGSDAHECRIEYDGKGRDLGEHFTHIKMDIRPNDTSEEIFRSLRLALLCGQSRVLESPTEDGYNYYGAGGEGCRLPRKERVQLLGSGEKRPTILGITVKGKGTYADGLSLRFNPYLNCIVGNGGKSTLVRLVGHAFGALGFMSGTPTSWLPEVVRVFWREGTDTYCIQRRGKDAKAKGPGARFTWFKQLKNGQWKEIPAREDAANLVEIWPPPKSKDRLCKYEASLINDLRKSLDFKRLEEARPLLVNQPRDIFNSETIFREVLSKPHLKARQIIWSTGSPNGHTALDAEKIVVTREKRGGKQMELLCAGDLHEDEIRDQFLNHMEGGWPGFVRRELLYRL